MYQLTDTGRVKLDAWMSELLSTPVKEYPQFEAALSLLPVLHPDTVLDLLRLRTRAVERQIAEERVMLEAAKRAGLPRLLLIESEYSLAMRDAELAWVRDLADELEAGTLEGQDAWRQVLETGEIPDWVVDTAALEALKEELKGGGKPG